MASLRGARNAKRVYALVASAKRELLPARARHSVATRGALSIRSPATLASVPTSTSNSSTTRTLGRPVTLIGLWHASATKALSRNCDDPTSTTSAPSSDRSSRTVVLRPLPVGAVSTATPPPRDANSPRSHCRTSAMVVCDSRLSSVVRIFA